MIKTVTVVMPYEYYDDDDKYQTIQVCHLQNARFQRLDEAAASIIKAARKHCELTTGLKFLGNVAFKVNSRVRTYTYLQPDVRLTMKIRYDREMSDDEIEKEKEKHERRKEKIQADIEALKLRGEKVQEQIAKLEAKV